MIGETPKRASSGTLFATTRWSLVVAAGQLRSPASEEALASLCKAYWHPVYAFVRRRGHAREDAEDLTQAFFTRVLEKNYLGDVRRERGSFRAFLLAAVQHFLSNERVRQRAAKRGGGAVVLSLDFDEGEALWSREPSRDLTPEKIFERRWALTLLERVLGHLRGEYERSGKARLFALTKVFLLGSGVLPSYREVAAELGMKEGAVKVAVYRLRRRFGQLMRSEISQTVSSPEETDGELRYLLTTLATTAGATTGGSPP